MVMAMVRKGKPEPRSKKRKGGQFHYFKDNMEITVNTKGEMKGSTTAGPVAKEYRLVA